MPEPIHCPNCGASVSYSGSEASVTCPYCNSTVPVPAGTSVRRWWQALTPNAKLIIVVVIAVFVLPTCVGVAVSLLGVCVPLLAGVVGLVMPFLVGH